MALNGIKKQIRLPKEAPGSCHQIHVRGGNIFQGALEFGTLTVTRSADEASSLFALLEKQQVTGGKIDVFAVGNVSGQGSDTFIHRIGDNNDTITDFNVNADVLDLIDHGFSSFAEVMALATDTAPGAQIDLAGADSVLLQGVVKAAIGSEDILIV